ncbi:FkbM family methyltransferase [Sandarakinorhabdus sp. AAP62]|uniref:FkbM family methyltransferase n=1 Tax=Sandarakinorhabdus sp. AAP62 TaxID=1248916 RepID=UPI0002F251B0|nr:FkbM family methyltransferase [Sandarakinorhabdus sp. AAP62]
MSGEWFARYVKAPRHPGKGRVIRTLLRLADGRRLPSVYGPLMTVRSHDATNRFALLGTLAEDYRDVHAQIMAMQPGECFIDIGANLGLFTMVASRHLGPEGRVVAFEPNQKTFADLAGNLAANNCTNVVTVCAGVSNTTARVAFDPGPAGHSGVAHISESGSSAIMVLGSQQVADLILNVAAGRRITIKIDVEGHENQVIEALMPLLGSPQVVKMVVEVDPDNLAQHGTTRETLFARLAEKGLSPSVNEATRKHYNEVFVRG